MQTIWDLCWGFQIAVPLLTSLTTQYVHQGLLFQGSVGEQEQDPAIQGDSLAPFRARLRKFSFLPSSNPKSPFLSQTAQLCYLWDPGQLSKTKSFKFFFFSLKWEVWSPEQKALITLLGGGCVEEDMMGSFFHKEQKWLTPQKIKQLILKQVSPSPVKQCLSHTLFPGYGASPGRGSRPNYG